jgi:hypothetical protein
VVETAFSASVAGYGREKERDADLGALRLLSRAGYPLDGAERLFDLLSDADPALAEPFFHAKHPSNEERAAYTRELLESGELALNPGAAAGAEEYVRVTRGVALGNVQLRLDAKHFGYALALVGRGLARYPGEARLHLAAGDAHRGIASDPEAAAAEAAALRREKPGDEDVAHFRARASAELAEARAAYGRALALDPSLVEADRRLAEIDQRLAAIGLERR